MITGCEKRPFSLPDLDNKKGTLYLLPNTLGSDADAYATALSKRIAQDCQHFVVEEIKSARKLLRSLGVTRPLEELEFYMLNEHTRPEDAKTFTKPLAAGHDMAVISEAGVPCVADPGSAVVALAHEQNFRVIPISGPSSIIMALMASGMNGQLFTFNGYLPREKGERTKKIRQLEQLAIKGHTQLFMDAPYRNNQVLDDLLSQCRMDTKLCIAKNISCPDEKISTMEISGWHMARPDLHKQLVMFVLGK